MTRNARQRAPRGATLIEMIVVIAILGVLAALAVAPLGEALQKWSAQAETAAAAAFVESARQLAVSEGRCHRVIKNGNNLEVQRRLTADCFNLEAQPGAQGWQRVSTLPQPARVTFDLAGQSLTTPPNLGDDDHRIVFRPSGRLWGDGDVDVSDDGARLVLRTAGGEVRSVNIMAHGRVCTQSHGTTLPALSLAAVRCP